MIAQSVKNRVAANRATDLAIIRNEQLEHIPFLSRPAANTVSILNELVIDGTSNPEHAVNPELLEIEQLVKGSRNSETRPNAVKVFLEGPEPGQVGNMIYPPVALYAATQKSWRLKTYVREHIWSFLGDNGIDVPKASIPKCAIPYRAAETSDGTIIKSALLVTSGNATRSASFAQYLWRKPQPGRHDNTIIFYGQVLIFLRVELINQAHPPLFLALVQDFNCSTENRLKRIEKQDRQDIIAARDIVCSVGIVCNPINNCSYVVRKRSALIG